MNGNEDELKGGYCQWSKLAMDLLFEILPISVHFRAFLANHPRRPGQ
jgi:hypothetical protein